MNNSEIFEGYTHEDIRQISGGDDGLYFHGPQEQDPLGQLFEVVQNGVLLKGALQPGSLPEIATGAKNVEAQGNVVPKGVEVEL